MRRWLLALAVVLAWGTVGWGANGRPNVVVLLSDDQRYDTIAALGNKEVRTPHLDSLVARGFAFTHSFIMGGTIPAVCAPSRAMLLTGRTLFRAPIPLPATVPTWPETMRKAGYTTFGTGKWHNGQASFARCFSDGGAIFFGGMADHDKLPVHPFDPTGNYPARKAKPGKKFSSELLADEAVRFLRGRKKGDKQPFLLYVAFTAPHDPRTPPKEIARLYDPNKLAVPASFLPRHPFDNGELEIRDEKLAPWPRTPALVRKHTADYYGMITHMDAQIGRILSALRETGREEDTVVVFAGDNGLALGRHGLMGKQNLYDHSVRVPLIVAGPGVPRGQKSAALCYLFDVFPTVCELTGVQAPDTVEGTSLVPILQGKRGTVRDSVFAAYRDVQRMVRTDRYKLIRYPHVNRTQLFDVQADPDETKDLSAEPSQVGRVKALMDVLRDWQKKLGDRQPLSTERPGAGKGS